MQLIKPGFINYKTLILFIVAAGILAGCATQPVAGQSETETMSFVMGLIHGFCILFSLIGSYFTDVRIYAFPNSGGWYDIGFVLGAAMFLGAAEPAPGNKKVRPQKKPMTAASWALFKTESGYQNCAV